MELCAFSHSLFSPRFPSVPPERIDRSYHLESVVLQGFAKLLLGDLVRLAIVEILGGSTS